MLKCFVLLQMIAAVVQFIKEQKCYMFVFVISLTAVTFGCYMNTLQTTNHLVTGHLQSAKTEIQRLIDEKTQTTNSLKEQLQLIESTNQRLLDEKKELQNEIDQNKADLHLVRRENQRLLEEKIKILEKIDQMNDDQKIYNTQLQLIDKCTNLIYRLEDDVRAMIHCSESKRKITLYANSLLCSKVGFNFDESFTGEIILRQFDLIMKYRVICTKFMDALLLKKNEQMKEQQSKYDMEKLKEEMEKLFEELTDDPKYQQSKQKDVERDGILTTLYKYGKYVFGVIAGVFFS